MRKVRSLKRRKLTLFRLEILKKALVVQRKEKVVRKLLKTRLEVKMAAKTRMRRVKSMQERTSRTTRISIRIRAKIASIRNHQIV